MLKLTILSIISIFFLTACGSENEEKNELPKPEECAYLNEYGIYTEDYKKDASEETEKVCFSNYTETLDSKENNLAYYAYGTSYNHIQKVILTLSITNKNFEKNDLKKYGEIINALYTKYTKSKLDTKTLKKIQKGQPIHKVLKDYEINLDRYGNSKQYQLTFEIKRKSFHES